MSFMGIPQGEYKTGSNPRRQILAPNGKNVPTSYACMSTAGAQDVHFCASDIVRPETQNSLAEGGCQKGFLKKNKKPSDLCTSSQLVLVLFLLAQA